MFDDVCEEIFNESDLFKLSTAGRHKNVHVFCQAQFFSAKKTNTYKRSEYNSLIIVLITSRHTTNWLYRQTIQYRLIAPSCVSVGNKRRFWSFAERLVSQSSRTSYFFVKHSSIVAYRFLLTILKSSHYVSWKWKRTNYVYWSSCSIVSLVNQFWQPLTQILLNLYAIVL